ncbi:MAG: CotH kinase family protein [Bacteroidota bacterium]
MQKLIYLALLFPFFSFSQNAGDSLFNTNQVIRVDITFNQTGFWDSLVANYTPEKDMMAAGLQITDSYGVRTMDSIAIRLKGNSSYGHPGTKKSFKIDVNQYVQGQDYRGLKKLNFNNGFKDPTFMREKVYFDLCKEMNVPAPRVNFANVYMNGTFWGFYTIVEQIDDQYLDWAFVDDTGNLFKAGDNTDGQSPADLANHGTSSSDYSSRYELKTNEDLNDWSDLLGFIKFIDSTTTSEFTINLASNINLPVYLKSLALDNLFSSLDSYLNSARNYYIYNNGTTGLWEWIKWDGNEAFGLYTGGPGLGNLEQLAPNYIASSRPLVSKIFASTTLYATYKDELCSIMDSYFNPTYMNTKIDAIKTLIQADVLADDLKMYSDQNFLDNTESNITVSGGPMGSQTVFGLKSFVANRSSYLNSLICPLAVNELEKSKNIVSPNPFSDNFTISTDIESIEILDASGRKIDFKQVQELGNSTITLNAKAGIYFLNLKTKNGIQNITLVKE